MADILGLIGRKPGAVRELDEVHDAGQTVMGQAFGHDPAVIVEHLTGPDHADPLVPFDDRAEQAAIPSRADDDLAIGQQLRRFGPDQPPDDMVAAGIELCHPAFHTAFGWPHVMTV